MKFGNSAEEANTIIKWFEQLPDIKRLGHLRYLAWKKAIEFITLQCVIQKDQKLLKKTIK